MAAAAAVALSRSRRSSIRRGAARRFEIVEMPIYIAVHDDGGKQSHSEPRMEPDKKRNLGKHLLLAIDALVALWRHDKISHGALRGIYSVTFRDDKCVLFSSQ